MDAWTVLERSWTQQLILPLLLVLAAGNQLTLGRCGPRIILTGLLGCERWWGTSCHDDYWVSWILVLTAMTMLVMAMFFNSNLQWSMQLQSIARISKAIGNSNTLLLPIAFQWQFTRSSSDEHEDGWRPR